MGKVLLLEPANQPYIIADRCAARRDAGACWERACFRLGWRSGDWLGTYVVLVVAVVLG
jgi:hypothetical protein